MMLEELCAYWLVQSDKKMKSSSKNSIEEHAKYIRYSGLMLDKLINHKDCNQEKLSLLKHHFIIKLKDFFRACNYICYKLKSENPYLIYMTNNLDRLLEEFNKDTNKEKAFFEVITKIPYNFNSWPKNINETFENIKNGYLSYDENSTSYLRLKYEAVKKNIITRYDLSNIDLGSNNNLVFCSSDSECQKV